MLAAGQRYSTDIVAALIKATADPNIKHRVLCMITNIVMFILTLLLQANGTTALWYAAAVGNVSVVEMLLENGATMDDRDEVYKQFVI